MRDLAKYLVPKASTMLCRKNLAELATLCKLLRLYEVLEIRTLYALLSSTVILLLSSSPSSVNAITMFSSMAAKASHPTLRQPSTATKWETYPQHSIQETVLRAGPIVPLPLAKKAVHQANDHIDQLLHRSL